ncbi:hypothetical protein GCM10028796_46090 [Ramlibacter monticola]|uniref:Periplasmic heavy metal sensor n=1 Tax=Ramlibacter monticola TaxID=1926872 RepID=A0A936Z3Z9_9BURK|nr:periplasmic heavy metal sensor [Ramlibacter monticola]MBL0393221.1 periplasmic heavy metal sensor [Ramlibacter monticola]
MSLKNTLIVVAALAGPAFAQVAPGPYAGQQARAIKALSEEDRTALLEGQGMGAAKAAELNGYPGPTHVLELASHLQLSPQQRDATRKLLAEHKAAASQLGASIVEAERALDELFASRRADEASVRRATAEIARLQGELRFEHLKTHLAQAALLRPEQVQYYARLRGYDGQGGGAGGHQHRH